MLKINELTENDSLKATEVTDHAEFEIFLDPKPTIGNIEKSEKEIEEYKRNFLNYFLQLNMKNSQNIV